MKKYVLVFSFFLFSFSVFAQNFDSLISKTEKEQFLNQKNEILMLLFDGIEITNQHQKNEVKWKPNFYENKQVVNFDDDFAYTGLDTVFFYQEGDTKKAVVIFATYVYENNKVINCHSCAPNISVATFKYDEKLKKWESVLFEKFYGVHGNWGGIHPMKLKKIGENKYAILFHSGFTHMGTDDSWTTIYDLYWMKKLKTIRTYHDNSGYYPESEKEKIVIIDTDIEFEKSDKEYYDLIITTKVKDSTSVEVFEHKNIEGYVSKE
ncbi:hypothetical protein ACE193_08870 [Bernardetia sp. OM2101]|uniref:hypothetical protein n=1 Tax=Bernardetia sp. OM2101 TaxID=3344876 RepID=UPI0035CFECF4